MKIYKLFYLNKDKEENNYYKLTAKFKLLCYNHTLDNNEIPEEFPFYQYLKLEALKTNKKI